MKLSREVTNPSLLYVHKTRPLFRVFLLGKCFSVPFPRPPIHREADAFAHLSSLLTHDRSWIREPRIQDPGRGKIPRKSVLSRRFFPLWPYRGPPPRRPCLSLSAYKSRPAAVALPLFSHGSLSNRGTVLNNLNDHPWSLPDPQFFRFRSSFFTVLAMVSASFLHVGRYILGEWLCRSPFSLLSLQKDLIGNSFLWFGFWGFMCE